MSIRNYLVFTLCAATVSGMLAGLAAQLSYGEQPTFLLPLGLLCLTASAFILIYELGHPRWVYDPDECERSSQTLWDIPDIVQDAEDVNGRVSEGCGSPFTTEKIAWPL